MSSNSRSMKVIVSDPKIGLTGYVVVDTLHNGQAMGGTRIAPGVSLAEISRLAGAMSLKLALAGVPIGGSKAGIDCALPNGPKRNQILARFGELVAPLLNGGIYMGTDLGTSFEDRQIFHDAAEYTVPVSKNFPCSWAEYWKRTGEITGHGAFESCMELIGLIPELPSKPTVVIQGFGKAGQSVAKRFAKIGAKVIGIADVKGTIFFKDGIDVAQLLAITDSTGTIDRKVVPREYELRNENTAWLSISCDVLVLAARGDAIDESNEHLTQAKVMLEAANHPITLAAQAKLHKRGVKIVPDILANCGGGAITGIILLDQIPKTGNTESLVQWSFDTIAKTVRENMRLVTGLAQQKKISLPAASFSLATERAADIYGSQNPMNKKVAA